MPRKKPTINLDVDGVGADFVGGTLMEIFMRHNVIVPREAAHAYDFHKLPTFEPYHKTIVEAWNRQGFCFGLRPMPGAQAAIAKLRAFANIRFVTTPLATNKHWQSERLRWLRIHFDAGRFEVHFDTDKTKYPALLFADDKPSHVAAWQAAHPDSLALIWDAPYNIGIRPRVGDWNTFFTIGERLCKSKPTHLPTIKAELLTWLNDSPKTPGKTPASASSKASPARAKRTR